MNFNWILCDVVWLVLVCLDLMSLNDVDMFVDIEVLCCCV